MTEAGDNATKSEKEYVGKRAELLAQLVLTRRKDIEVIPVGEKFDVGIDLVVRIHHPFMNGQALPAFGVQVKGTNQPIPDEHRANEYANAGVKHRKTRGFFLFPLVVFLFSMDGDVGYYGWLMKPEVSNETGPSLSRVESFEMTMIRKKSIDDMITQIRFWFEKMSDILTKDVSAKK
jgi:hypothetical protein